MSSTSNFHLVSAEEDARKAFRRGIIPFRHLVDSEAVFLSLYQQMPSLLQEGPKCGLVALCMLANMLGKSIQIEDIFSTAKSMNFTRQGEMFSVENMCNLADHFLQCRCETIDTNREAIVKHLLKGRPLLVPYDSDFNHEPCLKKGHKAHWAAITGIVFMSQASRFQDKSSQDQDEPDLFHLNSDMHESTDFSPAEIGGDVFVYAKHGKSKLLALWSLDQLIRSNQNLREMDPVRARDIEQYVVPPGGVQKGLFNKSVLVNVL